MKLISYSKEKKEYNGNAYFEYSLRLRDGEKNRLVKITGRVPVFLFSPEGGFIDAGRLDETGLSAGAELVFWFDLNDRISQIDVQISEPAEPSEENIISF